MKLEDLKPGLYVLTEEVDNPAHDKRTSRDWMRAPKFEKLTMYVVTDRGDLYQWGGYSHHSVTISRLVKQVESVVDPRSKNVFMASSYGYIEKEHKAYMGLIDKLVPGTGPENELRWIFAEDGTSTDNGWHVLRRLVKTGVVKPDQIRQALADWNAEYNLEEAKS